MRLHKNTDTISIEMPFLPVLTIVGICQPKPLMVCVLQEQLDDIPKIVGEYTVIYHPSAIPIHHNAHKRVSMTICGSKI
jgi:hypothetical protein